MTFLHCTQVLKAGQYQELNVIKGVKIAFTPQ